VRQIDLRSEKVGTLIGGDLFQFGDVDGAGDNVRLQHPLGIAFHDGKIYLADTYNHKIKVIDPNLRTCKTLFGKREPGHNDGVAGSDNEPRFYEPSGLAFLGSKLYIADTNNHAIRVADLHSKEVKSVTLKPQAKIEANVPHADHLVSLSTPVTKLPGQTLSPEATQLLLKIELPAGTINGALEFESALMTIPTPKTEMAIPFRVLPDFGGTALRVELLYYYCQKDRGLCMVRQAAYEMTILLSSGGEESLVVTDRVEGEGN
jgi:hypothetical protein